VTVLEIPKPLAAPPEKVGCPPEMVAPFAGLVSVTVGGGTLAEMLIVPLAEHEARRPPICVMLIVAPGATEPGGPLSVPAHRGPPTLAIVLVTVAVWFVGLVHLSVTEWPIDAIIARLPPLGPIKSPKLSVQTPLDIVSAPLAV
jgi:hypothetical protein